MGGLIKMGFLFNKNKEKDNSENKKIYDKVVSESRFKGIFNNKKNDRIASVFLYERVGEVETFIGVYPLLKGKIKDLGQYCVIDFNNKKVFLNIPHYNDYTFSKDPKIGKILEVVKFAEDDFRVKARLNEEYFTIKEVPKMVEYEVCNICENDWDKCKCPNKSEDFKNVIRIQDQDKKGNLLFEKIEESWSMPKSVTQEGRDSIREANEYHIKMEEYKKKNDWLSKYGSLIVPIVALVLVTMIFIIGMKWTNDNLKLTAQEVHYASQESKWWENPEAITKITQKVEIKQAEINKPPA